VSETTPVAGRTPVSLGTATPGGGFPVYGLAVAATINEVDPTLDVRPRNTKGSTENVPLLEAGALDLALVQGEVAHEALAGIGRAPADLRVLAAMYSTPGMFVVRADSPCRAIADLAGRPVAFGARGSGLIILARYVLDGLGFERDRDFQTVFLEAAGDGPRMVMDGTVAALWGGGLGWPGFTAVARGPAGARFLVPDLDGIHRIQTKHPFLKLMRVPADSSRGRPRTWSRWARGASSWRARRWPTRWPIAWRARCTGARPRSGPGSRRRARPPPPIRRPRSRARSCCTPACGATSWRLGSRADRLGSGLTFRHFRYGALGHGRKNVGM
jgi:TRAP transporter TAXI family solute receptor